MTEEQYAALSRLLTLHDLTVVVAHKSDPGFSHLCEQGLASRTVASGRTPDWREYRITRRGQTVARQIFSGPKRQEAIRGS